MIFATPCVSRPPHVSLNQFVRSTRRAAGLAISIYFSLTFRLLLVLLLRSPPPSPSSFPFPSPPSIRPPPSLLSNLRVWLVISIPFPSASPPSLAISIVITPGRGTSLGGSGLGVPRVPPPEPAFPYAPGHLGRSGGQR